MGTPPDNREIIQENLFQMAGQTSPVFDAGLDTRRIGIPQTSEAVVHYLEPCRIELSLNQLDGFAAPAVTAESRRFLVSELQALHLLQKSCDRGQNTPVDRRRANA